MRLIKCNLYDDRENISYLEKLNQEEMIAEQENAIAPTAPIDKMGIAHPTRRTSA
ncbi:hypothetical protein NDI39_23115 [Microcoleus sp. ZQ-A2]|nr:hypothetical protein [Microcoleus sp. FACHB-1]